MWAVASGCIPVLFRSNTHDFWSGLLDHSAFALVVEPADIPRLDELLRAVTPARRRQLRAALQRHHRLYLWEKPYGLAYDLTLHALCQRAARLPAARASLRCAAALPAPPVPPVPLAAGRSLLQSGAAIFGRGHGAGNASARRELELLGPGPGPGMRAAARRSSRGARGAARSARGGRGGRGGARQRSGVVESGAAHSWRGAGGGGGGGGGVRGGGVRGGRGGGVRCSAECAVHAVLWLQIESDLAALNHHITKPKVDSALQRWGETSVLGSVMLLNGSMYMLRTTDSRGVPVRHDDPQLQSTLKQIYDIVSDPAWPRLPDLELLVNADDYGRVGASEQPVLPLPPPSPRTARGPTNTLGGPTHTACSPVNARLAALCTQLVAPVNARLQPQ